MSRIFISHVGRDAELLQQIQQGLEAAGYATWFFERDVLPGTSYLIQITEAIEQCDALVLVVSPNAIGSDQVTKEVVGAFERRKPIFPVLVNIRPTELKERQLEWRHALGGTAMITVGPEGLDPVIARIVEGLKAQGIQPEGGKAAPVVHGSVFTTPKTYTPKPVADKIVATRSRVEGERKQVTVLFADVIGFTSISERMDPEEVQELVAPCIDFMTEEIHRYEGTIAQFLGDGIMALFGAPIAHEDAAQRALYAALSIQGHLKRYADELKAKGIQFNMRIGLNTGLVIVGRIGDDLTMEYTAMGDTVNLASRMESTAEPGTIQVAENTHRLTEGYFEFEPLGDVQVKGKEEPVKAYRVLGVGPARTRLAASLVRGLTPFVGRKRELEHLADCFDRVKEGQGQVVGIVGEPGVGKSRLVFEFTQTLPADEYTYLEGGCLHYGGTIAYQPLLEILRSYFDIGEGEQESVVKKKMEDKIDQLDERLKGILPPLHDLLSLKVEDEGYLKLEPRQKRETTFEAIRNLLIRESQNRPLILAIEDLHWIDKTSEEFLTYLIGGLATTHILLIILYRPEYTHLWGSKTYYSQVRVDQLSTTTSAELVQCILEGGEVEPELRELVLNRAAGNPLFMEEFTRTLVEHGHIQRKKNQYVLSTKASDIQVPDTVQGIISARMDHLEETLKRTMQTASVIGREFAYHILQTITGMQEELKSYLLNLQGLEFIYEKSLFPELEYIFKHALTQEVAYNSLLLKRRREIHERIGQAIEELYPDRLEEFYEVLAHHYSRSENLENAYHYLKLSGEKAQGRFSTWEAFRFYREAIEAISKLPDTEANKRRGIEVRLLMVPWMMALNYPEDSLQILQEGQELSTELADERSLALLYSCIGAYYTLQGDPVRGTEYCENAFKEAEKIRDVDLMAASAFDLCVSYHTSGELAKVVNLAPKVVALLEETKREYESFGKGVSVYCLLLCLLGHAMGWLGDFDEGEALCDKGLCFAHEINDVYLQATSESQYGILLAEKGEGRNAAAHLQNCIKYCEESQLAILLGVAWAEFGYAQYLLGDLEVAREHAERAVRHHTDTGISYFAPVAYWVLGMVYLDSGDLEKARTFAEQAVEFAHSNNERHNEASAIILLGSILGKTAVSQGDRAEEYILQGMNMLDGLKLRPKHSQAYFYLGELYAENGQTDKALKTLKKAEAEFKEMGMEYWLRRTQEVLARLQQ